jgi:excisionase family DNA binding protein
MHHNDLAPHGQGIRKRAMVQGYYNLEEAARILGMDGDKLSQMAQRREIRAFADRGTWRFRTQDVEEMARRLGMGSNPDIQLGDPTGAKPAAKAPSDDVFDFSLESEGTEHEIIIDSPSSSKIRPMGPTARPSTPRPSSAKSPSPKPGSDSDVHLVFDVTDELPLLPDSDVKLEPGAPKSGPKTPRHGGPDSGVRLVPMEDDRGAPQRRPTPSDSDIRLEPTDSQRRGTTRVPAKQNETSLTTEEINLDAELGTTGRTPKPKSRRPDAKATPTPKSRQAPRTPPPARRAADEDEVSLGDLESEDLTGVSSGINLHSPADSGINLAKPGGSDDSLEFELTLDQESTPRPKSGAAKKDSSGEFELTLDEGGTIAPLDEDKEDKDIFETDFDMPALDDESGSEAVALEGQDTELESSDFDLALGDEESGSQVVALDEDDADEGAATAVARGQRRRAVAEDDDAEEIDDLLVEDIGDVEEDDAVSTRRLAPAAAAAPANWGALPAAVPAPCIVIMFLVGIMSFELLHSMSGYKQPHKASGFVTKSIAGLFGEKLPE